MLLNSHDVCHFLFLLCATKMLPNTHTHTHRLTGTHIYRHNKPLHRKHSIIRLHMPNAISISSVMRFARSQSRSCYLPQSAYPHSLPPPAILCLLYIAIIATETDTHTHIYWGTHTCVACLVLRLSPAACITHTPRMTVALHCAANWRWQRRRRRNDDGSCCQQVPAHFSASFSYSCAFSFCFCCYFCCIFSPTTGTHKQVGIADDRCPPLPARQPVLLYPYKSGGFHYVS